MFSYKKYITLNNRFNKSTNIMYDNEDCTYYIITKSTQDTLKTLFRTNYHNSIALIGPFGCGKSSLLLYINTLLSNNQDTQTCLETLQKADNELFFQYKNFILNRTFFKIKLVGEHTSFKAQIKNSLLQYTELKQTYKYLNKNKEFQLSKALDFLDSDISDSKYSDVIFSIDEFGKFIEYGFDDLNTNDIFDLQTLSEFINKKSNYKLIISLHKSFSEYSSSDLKEITYTDWEKIQGRFETIVFKDDYYEMLNIFKETIVTQKSKHIKQSTEIIHNICNSSALENTIFSHQYEELFEKIVPLHPFSAIVISEIFTKYFQNQRSVFSFLFSSEPNAFQEFIEQEQSKPILYSLSNLYDYVTYLLKVYSILLPDKELWYISEHQLQSELISNDIRKDIIKTIGLVQSFKLSNIIKIDNKYLVLALVDRYETAEIIKNIQELVEKNILVFQEQTQSFSLLEDSNIDINKELKNRISTNRNIDYEKFLNEYNSSKFVIAKRYFTEYGNKKSFEKIYIISDNTSLLQDYKIFFSTSTSKELLNISKENKKSIFFELNHVEKIKDLIKKIYALNEIQEEFSSITSVNTKTIISNMINDYSNVLEKTLEESYINDFIIYNGTKYKYSSQQLQKLLSEIVEHYYSDSPILNNYTFTHSFVNKGVSTTSIKNLFKAMLENSHIENLDIDKFPPEKALYLSVIKPSGIHNYNQTKRAWELSSPNNNLNFENVWQFIKKSINSKTSVESLIQKLEKEPFGLNTSSSLLIISLFIIVNNDHINVIRENTYTYSLTLDLLMNMWKAPKKYELQLIKLSKEQEALFTAYVKITTDLSDYSYSKDKVLSIIKVLHTKFSSLPQFAKNTKKLSQEAIALRSALISMKDPIEAFFTLFPTALGYNSLEKIDNTEFIHKFKSAFNEIALIYKSELSSLENFIASIFHLQTHSFPYADKLVEISNKLSDIEMLDTRTKAMLRSFVYSNSLVELIDNISVILINKKLHECYDSDIESLKLKLESSVNQILSKLELTDISNTTNEVRKVSLQSIEKDFNKIISINRKKLDTITLKVLEIKKMIPKEYTYDEKLYLISQLLNEEFTNE
ncbi:MAG: hypothetical protein IBX44_03600 [Sulfurospirillum sp.]|nr:hypothetical protein [Sulfurospirillum sp.]